MANTNHPTVGGPLEVPAMAISDVVPEDKAAINKPKIPTSTESRTIADLPNELLTHIFEYLDVPNPSAERVYDEPYFDVTESSDATLKAISLVSKRWRKAILPSLFKHARLPLYDFWSADSVRGIEAPRFLEFLDKNSISGIVKTLAVCVPVAYEKKPDKYPLDAESFWQSIFAEVDPGELLIVAPALELGCLSSCFVETMDAHCFDAPFHYLRLQQPTPTGKYTGKGKGKDIVHSENTIDHTIVGSSTSSSKEAALESQEAHTHHAESTGTSAPKDSEPLTLNSPPSKPLFPDQTLLEVPRVHADHSPLFDIRPWTNLLLNEGSFIKAYSTYDSEFKRAPSILNDLIGAPDDDFVDPTEPLISPSIREFSYVGIFPMTSHFGKLAERLPPVDRFYVQLVPRNDILEDNKKMEYVDANELWHQRNSSYAAVMRELFNVPPTGNYIHLREFESGDVADRDAWHMAVEFVKRAGHGLGWRVARDGVFVRDSKAAEEGSAGSEAEGAAIATSLSVAN